MRFAVFLILIFFLTLSCIENSELAEAGEKVKNQIAEIRRINLSDLSKDPSSFLPVAIERIERANEELANFTASTSLRKPPLILALKGGVLTAKSIVENSAVILEAKNRTSPLLGKEILIVRELKKRVAEALSSKNWRLLKNSSAELSNLSWRYALKSGDVFYAGLYGIASQLKLAGIVGEVDEEAGESLLDYPLSFSSYFSLSEGESKKFEEYEMKLLSIECRDGCYGRIKLKRMGKEILNHTLPSSELLLDSGRLFCRFEMKENEARIFVEVKNLLS
jgi:hypothetical protein